jgi:putative N6-adenine-specific DNA methylase
MPAATSATEQFFAPCPRGLESVLAQELGAMQAADVRTADGGVHFAGPYWLAYRANLESRIASRILWRVAGAPYKTEDDIYNATLRLIWPQSFDVSRTIRVNLAAVRCPLKSLDFVTLRIKDAICDSFRAKGGERPSVNTQNPDVRIHAFLTADQLTLYIDTSGEPLFKRGYRTSTGEAPLRENLAAGIVKLSGWNATEALLDPMCGSGTLLIEAAFIALNIAPGARRSFAFEKLKNFDARQWQKLKDAATAGETPHNGAMPIYGADLYGDELKIARENIAAAGLAEVIQLKQANVLEIPAPAASGVIVTNPPYGVRLSEAHDLAEFYPQFGNALKQRFAGWRAYVFTGDPQLPKLIRLSASRRTVLFNGALECRLLEYKLIAGSMRRVKPAKD